MYPYWSCASAYVCLSLAVFPRYCMDPDVTLENGRGCPLIVYYLADLQSVHGFRCYGNIARTRNVSEWLSFVLSLTSSIAAAIKPGIERVQALADILRSGYVVIATKPVHQLQMRPIVHN